MLDYDRLSQIKPGSILINGGRGPVIDNQALLKVLEEGLDLSVVLDVWEYEPDVNLDLLARVDIGTPHIAGYSLTEKSRVLKRCIRPCAGPLVCRAGSGWPPSLPCPP